MIPLSRLAKMLGLSLAWLATCATAAAVADPALAPPAMIHFGDDALPLPKPLTALEQKALQVLVYAYPKVYFDVIYHIFTNVETPSTDPNFIYAPVNQFSHAKRQQTSENKQGMAPNSDTLYSSAFFDVSQEPVVWHMPAWAGHYYVCPLHNTVADNISLGTRSNGNYAVDYLITGPHWFGKVPAGVQRVQVDSDRLWTVCRIRQDFDDASIASANAFQSSMQITPLSAWLAQKGGKTYVSPKGKVDPALLDDMKRPMFQIVENLGVRKYLERLVPMLSINTPTTDDREAVLLLKEFGVEEGKPFDWDALTSERQQALISVWPTLRPMLHAALATPAAQGAVVNGWPYRSQRRPLRQTLSGTRHCCRVRVFRQHEGRQHAVDRRPG